MQAIGRRLIVIGCFFLLIVFLVSAFLFFRSNGNSSKYTINVSKQTVIKELRSLNRLETASFTIEKVIDAGTNGNRFQQILFGDKILLIAHGEVIAGVDLGKLSEDHISINGDVLRLTLPASQILVSRLDNGATRVYDRRQGLLNHGDSNLESQARLAAEETIRQAACTGGILSEASKNARTQLTTLFKTLGFTTVIIDAPIGSC